LPSAAQPWSSTASLNASALRGRNDRADLTALEMFDVDLAAARIGGLRFRVFQQRLRIDDLLRQLGQEFVGLAFFVESFSQQFRRLVLAE
jgi:hypothetical protein